jgi:hypothetical protein
MARFSITPRKQNLAAIASEVAPALAAAITAVTPANRPGDYGTVISEVLATASETAIAACVEVMVADVKETIEKRAVAALVPAHGERKHHPYSPSSLNLREVCMGWQNRNETSEAAQAGTDQHEAADSGDHESLNDNQAEAVADCNEYVAQIAAHLGEGTLELREDYLTVDKEDTTAGYLDRGLVSPDRKEAHIVDFKFGIWMVEEAKTNLQGIAYGLGIVFKFPTIERFHVHFLLPHIGEGVVSTATFDRSEFPRLLLRIRAVVDRSKYADAIFKQAEDAKSPDERASIFNKIEMNATDGGCLFCNRKAVCPTLNHFALSISPKYSALQIPDIINPALITDPKDCEKALKFFAVMAGLAKDYRNAATMKALNSEDWIPEGYMLTSVSKRSITDKVKFKAALKARGFTEDQITEFTSFTFGPVEKIISQNAPRGEKESAVEQFALELKQAGAVMDGEPFPVLRQRKSSGSKLTT